MTHRGAGSGAGIDAICREPPPHRLQIKFSELFGLFFPRAGIQGARGGHHSAWPGARGGPRRGDALCISLGTDAEMSHLVPFLGTRCAHRLLPDIPPSP